MMTQTTDRGWLFIPLSAALGLGVLAAFGSAGRWSTGAAGGLLVTALGVYLVFGRSEWARAQGERADERQTSLNNEAMKISYYAVIWVAVIGFLWEAARGNGPGPFTLIAGVGGLTHMASLAVLQRRR